MYIFELNQPENAKKCLMECLKIYPKHEGVKEYDRGFRQRDS